LKERQTNLNFEEKDFSNEAFNNFRKNSNLDKTLSKQHILNNLNLFTNNKLSNAGILFFSNNIKYYYPTAIISCFLYSDKEQTEIIDSKEFTENFMSNLDNAYKYLISKLNTAIIIKDELRHKTKLELPKEALRETIIKCNDS
jgi:predicted HTH transcriptional regulator